MKSLICAVMITLFLAQAGKAQTDVSPAPGAKNAAGSSPPAAAQSPEVVEAGRMSVQSVRLYGEGKHDEAIALGKRALQVREKALGAKHPFVALSLINLALFYTAKKQQLEAINLYQRALDIYEDQTPPDHLKAIGVLKSLSLLYMTRGPLYKAEEALTRAVTKVETALGKEDARLIDFLFLLAELHQARGDYRKAEPLYQRALAIKEKVEGEKPATAYYLRARYACSLWKSGRYEEARTVAADTFGTIFDRQQEPVEPSPVPSAPVNVINGKALSLPKPSYPEEARAARVQGQVVVGVVIDEKGDVIRACALRGHKLLLDAAENAARMAKFSATNLGGQPIRVTGTISYNFVR